MNNDMDEATREFIRGKAQEIRDQLKGEYLMGYPIVINDGDQVLVAAWFAAEGKELSRSISERKKFLDLLVGKI